MDNVEVSKSTTYSFTCSKEQRQKWGYFEGDTTCVRSGNRKHLTHDAVHVPVHCMVSTVSTI